jgi:DNA-nicking Smr family endonuclease
MTKKKSRSSPVSPDDVGLFRASMADVTPLERPAKVEHQSPLPLPVPAQPLQDDHEALKDGLPDSMPWSTGTSDELSFARNGIGPQTIRKLRRGHWVIQGELDLHGLNVVEARELLAEFLGVCSHRGLRCVRIIHGKGLRSPNREPVLKRKVAHWLMQRDEILAFCQARSVDGGGGAMVVLLRGNPEKTKR